MKKLVSAGADAHPKSVETRMGAVPHAVARRVRTRRGTRLTDADFAAIVRRYEDAGDVQNADIIRRQWQIARATGDCQSGVNHEF
jgi:hypothetical protein